MSPGVGPGFCLPRTPVSDPASLLQTPRNPDRIPGLSLT
jgi:hypothetical protein